MSVIQNNIFPSGLGGANGPGLEPIGTNDPQTPQACPARGDRIRCAYPGNAQSSDPTQYAGYGGANDGGGLSGFTSVMNGFLSGLQNMLASLGQQFGLGGGTSPNSSGGGEQFFSNATSGSVGDPHDSFNGASGDGNTVNGKWDSMQSHGNLLSSDSFDGGYQVSTIVTQPNANGVTLNDSATIATANGATQVTMNRDGSYAVSSNGQNVALQTGEAVQLGDGESVTLNADKSLTETDANGSGGTISTTLRSNGAGGVDVSNSASNVDLGGYLVNRTDANPVEGDTAGPSPSYAPLGDSTYGAPMISTYATQPAWSWDQNLQSGALYNDTAERAELT